MVNCLSGRQVVNKFPLFLVLKYFLRILYLLFFFLSSETIEGDFVTSNINTDHRPLRRTVVRPVILFINIEPLRGSEIILFIHPRILSGATDLSPLRGFLYLYSFRFDHDSRFTIHDSRFTIHDSRFTIHDSRSTIHHPRSTIHDPPSTIHNFTSPYIPIFK